MSLRLAQRPSLAVPGRGVPASRIGGMDAPTHGIRPELEYLAVDIDSVSQHPRNPRNGDTDAIEESLRLNGQFRPLVVHKQTGNILAGNHTWHAAKALGWDRIAVTYVDADEEDEAVKILLADNRIGQLGRMDDGLLVDLLEELNERDGLDGTGYDADSLDDLLATLERVAVTPFQTGETSYNATERDVERMIKSHGGPDSATLESRGIRDIILALPHADADELGMLIARLREVFGNLSQGSVLLRAARCAVAVVDGGTGHKSGCDCSWCVIAREAGAA